MAVPPRRMRADPSRTPAASGRGSWAGALCTVLLLAFVRLGDGERSPTIPRSTYSRCSLSDPSSLDSHSPPWNPSSKIDPDGFLKDRYCRVPGEWEPEANIGGRHGPASKSYRSLCSGKAPPAVVRQVPGDGNCLFHSISAALGYAVNGTHPPMKDPVNLRRLRRSSAELRRAAVDCLSNDPRRRLFLQGREHLRARELVEAAAAQYNLSGEEYCEQMRRDSYWGGGPEIVALCNVLRRPIHVYELCSASSTDAAAETISAVGTSKGQHSQFRLRRMACFGSPKYDRREPIHILSADSRFPDVIPGRHLPTGNHFLALFPEPEGRYRASTMPSRSPRKVRGGGASGAVRRSRERTRVDNEDGVMAGLTGTEALSRGKSKRAKIQPGSEEGPAWSLFSRISRLVSHTSRGGEEIDDTERGVGFASLLEYWLDQLGRLFANV